MKEYLIAITKHYLPHILIAVLCFYLGVWWQSGNISVVTKPITKYIPAPKGYIDLPEYNFQPSLRYVITKPSKADKDTVMVRDTVYVPSDLIDRYNIISFEPIKVRNQTVFLEYWNPTTQNYMIDEYTIPEQDWRFNVYSALVVNIRQEFLPGIKLLGSYKKIGFSADAFLNPVALDRSIVLAGITYRLN